MVRMRGVAYVVLTFGVSSLGYDIRRVTRDVTLGM
jgi:hypothetical protein